MDLGNLEEDFTGGEGWLDDDGALESFLQEDALLDAIRDAPEVSHEIPTFEDYSEPSSTNIGAQLRGAAEDFSATSLATATAVGSSASAILPGSDPLDGVSIASAHPVGSKRHEGVHRFEIEAASEVGPKERRVDIKTFPWCGAALAAATVLWILVYGPDFSEPPAQVKLLPASRRQEPEIRMPTIDDDFEEDAV
eukprot:CAMPEP_0169146272 /NCGR_PEP_ID=MMETSP1015-20121227/47449_1 /TAXON_ID=342587 /ORGANISM="Karlodinium micrum, Strain CCMP2283" /LENGTH=194 /DNA_ID=CAMNT_0009214103 /DNA_START=94 /DNA_END=675 /DNA_ORIENTATION=-